MLHGVGLFGLGLLACMAACSGCGDAAKSGDPVDGGDAGDGGGTTIEPDCSGGWCRIPAGTFIMGSPEDEWGHPAKSEDQVEVTLTRALLIQQHELTQAEWSALGLDNPSGLMNDGTGDCLEPDCPVGNVTWFEAVGFANLLSQAHDPPFAPCYDLAGCSNELGHGMACSTVELTAATLYECEGFRLPTEAEWEYAVRAGTTTAFYSGDISVYPALTECHPDANLDKIAWYCHNAGPTTHPGGQKQPNGWGLYDMSGNAYEWVHDHYTPSGYGEGPLTDPDGDMIDDDERVFRGGGFNIWANGCRSADHLSISWYMRGPALGFRLVRTLHDD